MYFQNNDQMRLLESLLVDAREQETVYRERCKIAEERLADAQRVNMELIDTLKAYGFRYRKTADMRTWYLPK
ncbi:MAG: hypothetical protein VB064_15245 [Oscillospiraceae bacterium]|nr:hypothetical protein [Oscillospiraceae bacterium]